MLAALFAGLACSWATAQLQSLDGTWIVSNATMQVAGEVPGTVPGALFRAGIEGDPSYGYNQRRVLDYSTADNFTYLRSFVTPESCASGTCELIFDGIDTAAVIAVNGHVVGNASNMHRRYVFDVTAALNPSGRNNSLEVHITSAVLFALEYANTHGDPGCKRRNRGPKWPSKNGHGTICSTYIRKNTGISHFFNPVKCGYETSSAYEIPDTSCHCKNPTQDLLGGIVLLLSSRRESGNQCGCVQLGLQQSIMLYQRSLELSMLTLRTAKIVSASASTFTSQ
jgi:hypothetical protein